MVDGAVAMARPKSGPCAEGKLQSWVTGAEEKPPKPQPRIPRNIRQRPIQLPAMKPVKDS